MSIQSVLLPVFVYVLMVFGLLGGLIATSQAGRQARAKLFSASYSNQFEMPVLFFALVALALITRRTDVVFVILEWLFVVARLAQAGVHVTSNAQPWRGMAFAASAAIVLIGWIKLAIDVLTAA